MTSMIAKSISLENRLQPTDLETGSGQLVAVVGPNGGGKTSLLRALARVERAGGIVWINDENIDQAPVARRRRLLSFLPASRDIAWPISARDVIALGLENRNQTRITELVGQFELEVLAPRPVNSLSTGERARVLMARALAPRPSLLLLDEPLSNLDPYWVLRFLDVLQEAASSGQMLLVALHDLSHLERFDRALLVSGGRIQLDGTPAELKASERFGEIFRICNGADGRWTIRPEADRQSLQ